MSYQAEWDWNKGQLRGFQDALKGLYVEYRVVEMDTKRRSSEAWMQQVAPEAIDVIEASQPDLVYTNDDDAQQYVVTRYVGLDTPLVFSGVNADPAKYGFVGSPNVTGVQEIEHSLQTVRLLRRVVPDERRIALIVDEGATWPGLVRRMETALQSEPDVEIVSVAGIATFAEYRANVAEFQDSVGNLRPTALHRRRRRSGTGFLRRFRPSWCQRLTHSWPFPIVGSETAAGRNRPDADTSKTPSPPGRPTRLGSGCAPVSPRLASATRSMR
jgi:hypothetical protein